MTMDNRVKAEIALIIFIGFFYGIGKMSQEGAGILFAIVSLAIFAGGSWWNEFRYKSSTHIVTPEKIWSIHPGGVHDIGDWLAIAVGGFITGKGFDWMSGEGTLVVPKTSVTTFKGNPSRSLKLVTTVNPVKCDLDELPMEVQEVVEGSGDLKPPYRFSVVEVDLEEAERTKFSALNEKLKQANQIAKFYKSMAEGRWEGVAAAADTLGMVKYSLSRVPTWERVKQKLHMKKETPEVEE